MNTSTLQREQYEVSCMMAKYGGSFASALGVALSNADDGNALTIKSAWPELWKQFLLYFKKDAEKAREIVTANER